MFKVLVYYTYLVKLSSFKCIYDSIVEILS